MRSLLRIILITSVSPWLCLPLYSEDAEDYRILKEAIDTISNPETRGRRKHDAMVTLQELKDVRSVDALYEQIDFASGWGNPRQKLTRNTYPATYALILIGQPSIEGAERFVASGRSLNKDQLWLTTYVVGTIFQISTGEEPGSNYPKAREMTLEWIKKNFTVPQMKKAAERYSPDLTEYLATLTTESASGNSNVDAGKEESPPIEIPEEERNEVPSDTPREPAQKPAQEPAKEQDATSSEEPSSWLWIAIAALLSGSLLAWIRMRVFRK